MKDPKISELTVSQLKRLIRSTVQEAVAEVIIEFSAAAEVDAQLSYEAEMVDYLRSILQNSQESNPKPARASRLDD
jgi:recombinational DNA repair protein RecR